MKKGKKKSFIITFIGLTLVMVLGFLPCSADTYNTIYADGDIYVNSKLKLVDTDGTRYASSEATNFQLPYKYSASETVINTINYTDIFTNGIENINVNEIDFRFSIIFDEIITSNEFVKIKFSYRYQPGRASKLNFDSLKNNGQIAISETKESSPSIVLSFDEVNIINSTVDEISPTSYIYNLELELRVPNNRNMAKLEIICPTVIVDQTLNSASTNANPMIFGLQNAEVLLNTTDNINKEDVENAQNEANRLDGELGDLSDGMVVATPSPDDLLQQTDPFEVIDKDEFNNISNNLQIFIGENPVFIGMTTITFMFVLFKYVLFGKG